MNESSSVRRSSNRRRAFAAMIAISAATAVLGGCSGDGDGGSNVTLPNVTLPNVTLPNITLPNITLPNITLPNITLPNITLPNITLPNVTLPTITAPTVIPPAEIDPPSEATNAAWIWLALLAVVLIAGAIWLTRRKKPATGSAGTWATRASAVCADVATLVGNSSLGLVDAEAVVRFQSAQLDVALRTLAVDAPSPAKSAAAASTADALRAWSAAFESAGLARRAAAAPSPAQLQMADAAVAARVAELQAAIAGLHQLAQQ